MSTPTSEHPSRLLPTLTGRLRGQAETCAEPDAAVAVIEAPTARQALAEVHRRFGPTADIVSASKVMKGGVGGFFARELIQLRVQSTVTSPARAPEPNPAVRRLLDDLTDSVDDRERRFADVLRTQLDRKGTLAVVDEDEELAVVAAPDEVAASADVAAPDEVAVPADVAVSEDVAVPEQAPSPAGDTAPAAAAAATAAAVPAPARRQPRPWTPPAESPWDRGRLLGLGLPALVVDAAAPAQDEQERLDAIAAAVGSLCRPLPAGDQILAGPMADVVAERLGVALVYPPEAPAAAGSFAARVDDSAADRGWLRWHRDRRWLHLVVGGRQCPWLLLDQPAVVSWVGSDALALALRLAAEDGLVLGYGVTGPFGRPERVTAAGVAQAVRRLVVGR